MLVFGSKKYMYQKHDFHKKINSIKKEYLDTCNRCLQSIFNYDLEDDMSDIKLWSKFIQVDEE